MVEGESMRTLYEEEKTYHLEFTAKELSVLCALAGSVSGEGPCRETAGSLWLMMMTYLKSDPNIKKLKLENATKFEGE
jgi:hypothetical protein